MEVGSKFDKAHNNNEAEEQITLMLIILI